MIKLYIDLEGTIIDNWDSFEIIHCAVPLIEKYPNMPIEIFSFAVDNDKDMAKLEANMHHLNVSFNREFSNNFKVELLSDWYNLPMYSIKNMGKEKGFIDYLTFYVIGDELANTTFVLIDDMVSHMKSIDLGNGNSVLFLNHFVHQLYEE